MTLMLQGLFFLAYFNLSANISMVIQVSFFQRAADETFVTSSQTESASAVN